MPEQPQDLTVTLLQTELIWEDPVANCSTFTQKLRELKEPADLIILPEMFTTGFTMNAAAQAEKPHGFTYNWLLQMASEKNAAITGSIIVQEKGEYFNRLLWAQPDGRILHYDKKHLFRMARENAIYSAGKSKLVVTWRGWRICPLVCYDLRFPVWSRQQPENPYDLLIYVANWPEKRAAAWKTLLAARAIENLSYCIGVNRVGTDGAGIPYAGHSAICQPQGESYFLPENLKLMHTQTLSYSNLNNFRERFPAHLDADPFQLL